MICGPTTSAARRKSWPPDCGADAGNYVARRPELRPVRFDFGDINPFVLYLSDFAAWQAAHPGCPATNGDINGDGLYPNFATSPVCLAPDGGPVIAPAPGPQTLLTSA